MHCQMPHRYSAWQISLGVKRETVRQVSPYIYTRKSLISPCQQEEEVDIEIQPRITGQLLF